jgi:arylsulfatase A-like enzyme
MDAKVGQLVQAVDETHQRDETLILFFSDNGGLKSGGNPYVSEVPPTPVLSDNSPLRGQKNQLYEGGIRVCSFVNWPARLKPRKVTAPMHAVDWMPTLTKLVGWSTDKNLKWDGRDIWPLISGEATEAEKRTFYWAFPKGRSLRDGDMKLIVHREGKTELFDLAADPSETTDLASDRPEEVARLKQLMEEQTKLDRKTTPENARIPRE